jgi:hypothetical protein
VRELTCWGKPNPGVGVTIRKHDSCGIGGRAVAFLRPLGLLSSLSVRSVNSGSVFVEPLASGLGDREAGWLLGHPTDRAAVDQGVERIGQGTIVQARSGRGLKLLDWNTRCRVLGG